RGWRRGPQERRGGVTPAERRGPAVRESFTDTGGRGEMRKPPIDLQDPRRRIYVKAKAEGPITLGAKRTGEPGAGDPHAGVDVAGAGDVTMGAGLRPEAKAADEPPDPTVRAPVLDPTGGGRTE